MNFNNTPSINKVVTKTPIIYYFIGAVILLGLIFYVKNGLIHKDTFIAEGFDNRGDECNGRGIKINKQRDCPNMLVQRGSMFYLYNTNKDEVAGVNPIVFEDISKYADFIDWQHKVGIDCPILYLQQMNDSQGNDVYAIRPSVFEAQYGLNPSMPVNVPTPPLPPTVNDITNAPSNPKPFDPKNQTIGLPDDEDN